MTDRRPIVQTHVRVREPSFGWAWVGVGALALVGTLAIVNGRRHTVEAQQKGKGSRAHVSWQAFVFRRGAVRYPGRWQVDNGVLDVQFQRSVPYTSGRGGMRSIAVGVVAVPGLPQALAHHDLVEADRAIQSWLAEETRS